MLLHTKVFFKCLQQYGFHKITIITTNYDMIIEYLLHRKNVRVCYPISEKIICFDDLCDPTTRIATGLSKNGTLAPILCKLHGSINFFTTSIINDNKLHIVADTAQCKIGESKICPNAPSIMAVDAIHELVKNRGLEPEIIPPTYAKLRTDAWLRNIWQYAAESLINTNKWIFIGYSFPSTDGFMRILINLALMSRNGMFPEITIINPDGRMRINCCQIFAGNPFNFVEKGFSEFITSGEVYDVIA